MKAYASGDIGSRDKVLDRVGAILSTQGRKISDVASFVGGVMHVYDDVYFGGQIRRMAKGYGIDIFPDVNTSEDFVVDGDEQPLTPRSQRDKNRVVKEMNAYKRSSFGVCDIIVVYNLIGEPKSIKLDFYSSFFTSIKERYLDLIKALQTKTGDVLECTFPFPSGKQYMLYVIMYIVEHIIIHLLMVLWKYHEKGVIVPHVGVNYQSRWIYSTHGRLYRCLLEEYFGYRHPDAKVECMQVAFIRYYRLGKSDENAEETSLLARMGSRITRTFSPDKLGLLKWSNNSCFFDVMVIAILLGASPHIRDTIIKRAHPSSEYSTSEKFKNPFPGKKVTASPGSTSEFATTFRDHLKTTLDKLMDGNVFIACSIRSILGMVDSHINSGEQYEPYMVYGVLCNLFPHLKMRRIPNARIRKGKEDISSYLPKGEESVAFPMDDFVTHRGTRQDSTGVRMLFDDISKEEHLTFFIQHPPWLKKWNDMTDEMVDGIVIKKMRTFDEYILGGRYRLYAAILHSGNTPKTINDLSFGHYTLIVRPFFDDDGWYYYDDMMPSLSKVTNGNVPQNVFVDTGKRRPHMLLYERVR